jgi:hypothetical protein
VKVSAFPETPVLNGPWTVLILVDYPNPGEVILQPPPFPPSLSLERVFTGGRIVPGPGGEPEQWTAAEFSFILRQSGPLNLAPFEIRVADKRALTPPFRLFIRDAGDSPGESFEEPPSFFRWEGPPLPLTPGEGGEFALLLVSGNPQTPLPVGDLFRGRIPEELILEAIPLENSDRERGVVLRFRIIPLGAGDFELGLAGFPGVPVLLVKVQAAPEKTSPAALDRDGQDAPEQTGSEEPAISGAGQNQDPPAGPGTPLPMEEIPIPFPRGEGPKFFLLRTEYARARQNARELWEGGNRAEALAALRRGERDLLSGPALAPIRQDAERILALEPGEREKWRPRIFGGFLGTGSFILFLVSLAAYCACGFLPHLVFWGKKDVTSRRVRRYKGRILFVTVMFAAALFGLGEGIIRRSKAGKGPERGDRGVLRTVDARRVPDPESGVNVRFGEGQSVFVRGASNVWVYVESPDGRTGWVPEERIIIY